MSEDLSKRGNGPTAGGPTDDWIQSLADAEGLPREEMAERLVAAYWTLREMDGMMDQLEMGGSVGHAEEDAPERPSTESDRSTDRAEELIDRVEQLEARQQAVEDRVIEEFGYLRTILNHLIERTDSLQAAQSSDRASDRARTARDRRRDADEKRLVAIKRTASRHGIPRAACGHCGTTLDVGLLPTPDCPECRQPFASLEPSERRFGRGTDVLTVADSHGAHDSRAGAAGDD